MPARHPWRRWLERRASGLEEDPRRRRGREGERLAARYLRRTHRFKVLYRNYRAPGRSGGEVDLVCRDGTMLVFVEVKTRASLAFGRPAEAVNADKEVLIARGARSWLQLLDDPDVRFRFDIVEVLMEPGKPPAVNLIRDAFTPGEREMF